MRGGQKGFGWGRVCHNGAARDSRATTLILCHSYQTLCYTVWYQTTLCATTLPLWQLPWVWRIACLPSWLPTPPLRRGIHTNVGDIRWQSCPDPLCTHNHWCCVWHLIMWQDHLYSYLRNLYPMQFYQTINEGCFNLIEFPDWNNFLFLSEIPVVQMIIWILFSTGYVFVGELIACHSGYPSCWDTCKILVTWRLVWYASCNVGIRVAIRRTLWPSETQRSYLGCCFYSVGWGM